MVKINHHEICYHTSIDNIYSKVQVFFNNTLCILSQVNKNICLEYLPLGAFQWYPCVYDMNAIVLEIIKKKKN